MILIKVFFGQASDTYWESVTSFYYKSSYGRLKITGEVVNSIKISQSSTNLYEHNIPFSFEDPLYEVVSDEKRKEYDSDDDGFVDATIFIYSSKYSSYPVLLYGLGYGIMENIPRMLIHQK